MTRGVKMTGPSPPHRSGFPAFCRESRNEFADYRPFATILNISNQSYINSKPLQTYLSRCCLCGNSVNVDTRESLTTKRTLMERDIRMKLQEDRIDYYTILIKVFQNVSYCSEV